VDATCGRKSRRSVFVRSMPKSVRDGLSKGVFDIKDDNQIDVHTLMRECAEKHEEREAMSVMRQVWQRSGVRGKLGAKAEVRRTRGNLLSCV